jgi:phospholipase C
MAAQIEHVIVLMLENRSFDHMLGYLYPEKSQADFHGLQDLGQPFSNPSAQGDVAASAGAPWVTWPDPPHEHVDVTMQLYGTTKASDVYQAGTKPTMKGFVAAYRATEEKLIAERTAAEANGAPPDFTPIDGTGKHVMECFAADTLPALHALAREFAVCDNWFSSLPGPTWPNRFFAHCATSDNRVDMALADLIHPYDMETIFNHLEAKERSWTIYYHDIPQSRTLRRIRDKQANFKLIYDFKTDVENDALPNYSFIEPRYFDFLSQKANDQHPPHDVRFGDVLIGRVYEALRANDDVWKKSVLLVLWDEHGGYADHVPPSAVTTPSAGTAGFKFDWYGVRVPAVIISPFVEAGVVDHTQYDHTSIPATLKEIFALPTALTSRDGGAKTFTSVLSRAEPREVALRRLPRTPEVAPIWDLVEHTEQSAVDFRDLNRALGNQKLSSTPLSDLQKSLIAHAEETLRQPRGMEIRTEGEGALHVQQAMHWVRYVPPDSPGADG